MVVELLKKLIFDPGSAIADGKRGRSMMKTVTLLLINWIVAAISVAIVGSTAGAAFGPFSTIVGQIGGMAAVAVAVGGILLTLFIALLLQLTMNALGSKGGYWEGLSTLTYATWPLAIGGLIATLLAMFGGVAGIFISTLILAILGVLSAAIVFRSVKEMFGADYVTTLIALGIIGIGMGLAAAAATGAAAATLALNFTKLLGLLGGSLTLPVA